jgi:hypothetical protein
MRGVDRRGADGRNRPAPLSHRRGPNSAKQNQGDPNQIAWICLILFVRIGTFQRVTAEKIKKILSPFSSPPGVPQGAGSVGRLSERCSTEF